MAAEPSKSPPRKPLLRRIVWRIVRFVAIVYVGVGAGLAALQKRMIFYPTREITETPAAARLDYEDLTLTAADGVKINAWFAPAERERGVLIFCHGNAGNISGRVWDLRHFHDLGLSTLIFDYRGYGKSDGSAGEKGTYLDAAAAWDYLTTDRGVDPGRIVIFGRSLGGAVAIHLASEHAPGGLMIESAFTSIPDMAREVYPILKLVYPIRWMVWHRYDGLSRIGNVGCPVLIAHSLDDEMVPFEHGRRLFEAAGEPKEFLELTGDHNTAGLPGDAYRAAHDRFLTRCLGE